MLPADEQPVLRIVPMPADTNAHGTIFGGWVKAQPEHFGDGGVFDQIYKPGN